MFASFKRIATTEGTQDEFKNFFQAYHQHLQDKLNFPPLKVSKALHAASEIMDEQSWHHLIAKTQPSKESETAYLWMLEYMDKDEDMGHSLASPQFFTSESACVAELWRFVKTRFLEVDGILDVIVSTMFDSDYCFLNSEPSHIKEIHESTLPMLCEMIHVDPSLWTDFENDEMDITDDDIRYEFIECYFNIMDGDGVAAKYQIEPVRVKA